MIPKVTPFDCYKSYLGLKNHFTKQKYDYHRYGGKSRASLDSFYKRRDRFFFEKLSRQKDDSEVIEFFVSNFVSCDGLTTIRVMVELQITCALRMFNLRNNQTTKNQTGKIIQISVYQKMFTMLITDTTHHLHQNTRRQSYTNMG